MVETTPPRESNDNSSSKASETHATSTGDAPILRSDSNETQIQGSTSASRRKRPRLEPFTDSTAETATRSISSRGDLDTRTSIDTTEAETTSRPPQTPASRKSPAHIPTATETSLPEPFATNDPLTFLPLDLLGEVLTLTRSTSDILSLARCNRHLLKTLTAPPAAFIWKKTRKVAVPEPMPDPPSTLPESTYAAMVFDGGKCEICGDYTKAMYSSFAVKFRVCHARTCRRSTLIRRAPFAQLFKVKDPGLAIWERTPTIEREVPNLSATWVAYWPSAQLWCRTTEMNKIAEEYRREDAEFKVTGDSEEFQRKHQHAIKKNTEWMEFCVALSKWRDAYNKEYIDNKRVNDELSKAIAKSHGYPIQQLLGETSYGVLHRLHNKSLQAITMPDFYAIKSKVKAELDAIAERRKRRQRDDSYRTIYQAIQKYHEKLRNEMHYYDSPLVIPPFPTFRRLPVFASLLALADPDTSKSIQDILRKKGVRDVVKTELKKWENEAREALATILGNLECDPESGSKDESRPVDRWTAWFLCKQCTARAVQYKTQIEPLCFREACQHECFVPKGQKRKTNPWDATSFTKDEKAIAVLRKCNDHFKSTDPPTSMSIKCLSCQPYAIIQTTKDLVLHCHRHDDMEIDFMTADDLETQKAIGALSTLGLAKKLVRRTDKERDLKDCGCRSCLLESAQKSTRADRNELLAKQHKMTINGLRSHLKIKHGIEVIRDEDVYIFPI